MCSFSPIQHPYHNRHHQRSLDAFHHTKPWMARQRSRGQDVRQTSFLTLNISPPGILLSSSFIYMLDSFASPRPREASTVQKWLLDMAQLEAGDQRMASKLEVKFAKACVLLCIELCLHSFQVPRQTNVTDCGIFVIHYVRVFLEDPPLYCKWMQVNTPSQPMYYFLIGPFYRIHNRSVTIPINFGQLMRSPN